MWLLPIRVQVSIIWMVTKWIWKTTMSNNIFLSVHIWLLVSVCVCVCLVLFLYKNVIRKSFCFWKLYVNIVGENWHLLYAEFSFVTWNDEENNDYWWITTWWCWWCWSWLYLPFLNKGFWCPLYFCWRCREVGQEKQREGVIPDTSRARCSNTATNTFYPPTRHIFRKYTERYVAQIVACVISPSLYLHYQKNWLLLGCVRKLFTSQWSQSSTVAWHHISPCLLIGLGIYCNAIVLDGIGPVLTLMMLSSLNLESLLLSWRPYMGTGTYGGTYIIRLTL